MCGRFVLITETGELQDRYSIVDFEQIRLVPQFNITPAQNVLTIVFSDGKRQVSQAKWGLMPDWAVGNKQVKPMINARLETLAEKPFFRNALKQRRCLIPASGYYEWKSVEGQKEKIAMHIECPQAKIFAFAGIFEVNKKADGSVEKSCSIITMPANKYVDSIHQRMPAILHPEHEAAWIDASENDPAKILRLLEASAHIEMVAMPVARAVTAGNGLNPHQNKLVLGEGSAKHNGPEQVQLPLFPQSD